VAGNGTGGYNGDGGQATSAMIYNIDGVGLDASGNIYIADTENHRIRKVTISTGYITTVVGTGIAGYNGDGGQATAAMIQHPTDVTLDSSGNIYIADSYNNRIRKITISTGYITSVAGTGFYGFNGDGGSATSAGLGQPNGIALDVSGNIYVADSGNNRIRKVTVSTGFITTVAGNGTASYSGDGGQATSAMIYNIIGVGLDASGNIYIADTSNHRIRKVTVSTGYITTVAGTGSFGGGHSGDGGQATLAMIASPAGVAFDSSGNIYIADLFGIRKFYETPTPTQQPSQQPSPSKSPYKIINPTRI
jgi:sugar lactone lactonase YvrE